MPELPEVENLRRGLAERIVGQKVERVEVYKPKLISGKGNLRTASLKKKESFIKGLQGEVFSGVGRRAKNLIFRFKSGKVVLVHLKMSGQFVYKPSAGKSGPKQAAVIGGHPIELSESELPNKHTHVIFYLSKGTLFYNDTRMFGYLIYYPSYAELEAEDHFAGVGPEPFDPAFTPHYLWGALQKKKGSLKAVLMNQELVAGLGNIYADEAMFEGGVRPLRSASSLTLKEAEKLHAAIQRILARAIELGGSSVATYRLLDESRGNYAREHKVYGKAGDRCAVCGKTLSKILVQSRTTVFCPNCQR